MLQLRRLLLEVRKRWLHHLCGTLNAKLVATGAVVGGTFGLLPGLFFGIVLDVS